MSVKPKIAGVKRGDRQTPGTGSSEGRPGLKGYINFKPTTEQKDAFSLWYSDPLDVENCISRVLDSGWRIAVSSDRKPGVFVFSVSTWAQGHPSAGVILNTRASVFGRGVASVVWALDELYDYDLIAHLSNYADESDVF